MSRSSKWWMVVASASCVITLGVIYVVWFTTIGDSTLSLLWSTDGGAETSSPTTLQHRCVWREGDPVIYHMKTKMGVNYDAGHWFHMAENLMVQHSVLRSAGELTNASKIFYNFDKRGFISELNGVTRLMVYLGTHAPASAPETLYFTHMKSLPWASSLARVGSSVVIDHAAVNELQIAHLVDSDGSKSNPSSTDASAASPASAYHRFSMVQKPHQLTSALITAPRSTGQSTGAEQKTALKTGTPQRRVLGNSTNNDNVLPNVASAVSVPAPAVVSSVSSASRAVQSSAVMAQAHDSSTQICAKYMGTVGGKWPTVQRGHWFPNKGDIESFRDTMRLACPPDAELLKKTAKKKRYKMVIYQRDLSRKLLNQVEAVNLLSFTLGTAEWDIEVLMHSTGRSPCMLMHLLHNADILVTPHGFQSMLLLFLPRPSLIFEIFPNRYYKRGYGPFGAEYGVTHGGVMSPATTWQTKALLPYLPTSWCMLSKTCRNFARSQDVVLTPHGVNKLVAFIAENKHKLAQQPPNPLSVANAGTFTPDKDNSAATVVKRDFLY